MILSPERLLGEALAIRNHILGANRRLVVSIAKTPVGPAGNLSELVSDGNMSLIRAVEKLDFSRGNKFSTYASLAITRHHARTTTDQKSRYARFVTGHEEMFAAGEGANEGWFDWQCPPAMSREGRTTAGLSCPVHPAGGEGAWRLVSSGTVHPPYPPFARGGRQCLRKHFPPLAKGGSGGVVVA